MTVIREKATNGSSHPDNVENIEERLREEPKGWRSIAEVLQKPEPFFKNILILEGYDYSSNIYILVGDTLTIVDPGNDYTAYMELFQLPEYDPSDVKRIVLTHGHPDHAMGALELFRYPAIKKNKNLDITMHKEGPREFKRIVKEFGCVITELKGGEMLDLEGQTWEVIATPGHTVDGICLYHAPTGTLISGDMVMAEAMASPDKHAGGRMDHYLFSLRSLMRRDIQNVLPGHGAPVASLGKRVVEESYMAVIGKLAGIKQGTSFFDAASTLAQQGLLEEALYCCEKQLMLHPDDYRPWKLKALCHNDMGKFDEALKAFEKAEELRRQESDDTFALLGKGYALIGLGRHEESLRCFEAVLKQEPGRKEALIYKALALYLSGHEEEAMELEEFRTELVERFKNEILKKTQGPSPDVPEHP